jgi:hypothetical protein
MRRIRRIKTMVDSAQQLRDTLVAAGDKIIAKNASLAKTPEVVNKALSIIAADWLRVSTVDKQRAYVPLRLDQSQGPSSSESSTSKGKDKEGLGEKTDDNPPEYDANEVAGTIGRHVRRILHWF